MVDVHLRRTGRQVAVVAQIGHQRFYILGVILGVIPLQRNEHRMLETFEDGGGLAQMDHVIQ